MEEKSQGNLQIFQPFSRFFEAHIFDSNFSASKSDAESDEDFDKKLDRESRVINEWNENVEKLSKCCRGKV